MDMDCGFAIVADDHDVPSAVFTDLEAAIEWALAKFGGEGGFVIRRCDLVDTTPPSSKRLD